MAETNLERIQRLVSSYDTEAGERLRYHITRAQVSDAYATRIGFNRVFNDSERLRGLDGLFYFAHTPEGHDYWWLAYTKTS